MTQIIRDTRAGWLAADPVVPAGTVAVEIDTGVSKVGDGVTVWSRLPYPASVATILNGGADLGGLTPPTPTFVGEQAASHRMDALDGAAHIDMGNI